MYLALRKEVKKIKKIKNIVFREKGVEQANHVDTQWILREIHKFKVSNKRHEMELGEKYYDGKHDILQKVRSAIGENGSVLEVNNIPNNRIVDNQYKKMVIQKTNYLLGKPIMFLSEDELFLKDINKIFDKKFDRILNYIGVDCFNCGISYLYIYYDENGEFCFRKFCPTEIIPIWKNEEHNEIEMCIRVYKKKDIKNEFIKREYVEIYDITGIDKYELIGGKLVFIEKINYFYVDGVGFNWARVPIIPFRYNKNETTLLNMIKSLQDGINKIVSNFQDVMEEDTRNSILVLVNYDGENLGEFRRNLSTYGVVKVSSSDGKSGDVRSLQVEVNAENYKSVLQIFKRAIIENACGYDAKDERFFGNANQMNIMSMYNDIDLDANAMEIEFQASIEKLMWFVNRHLFNQGYGSYIDKKVDVLFNKDMMMNESDVIDNIKNSVGILSKKTLIEEHPWVKDYQKEIERIEEERINNDEREVFGNGHE